MKWHVLIVETETNKIERQLNYNSERRAYKAADGADINLNHEKYHTEVLSEVHLAQRKEKS